VKVKQFIKKLRQAGVNIIEGRGKGGHVLAKYNGKQTTIPIHGDADVGNIFLKKICKQLGIALDEIV
jgi:predicted RNA binding protein YcfA (HicA-like mRNA interferase family)